MKYWEHVLLMVLYLGATVLETWKPELKMYSEPLKLALMTRGIFKWSPMYGPPTKTDSEGDFDAKP